MNKIKLFLGICCYAFTANCYGIIEQMNNGYLVLLAIGTGILGICLAIQKLEAINTRLRICNFGANCLIVFLGALVLSIANHIYLLAFLYRGKWTNLGWSVLVCFLTMALLFWIGMLCIFFTSAQLGLRYRVIGALCGFIPIINLIVLTFMLLVAKREVNFEVCRNKRNKERKDEQVCKTRYPLLLVHGVFFRDFRYFNYWGRIPKELEANGASIYYGNHQSAASVQDSAAELTQRIKDIVSETGCEKVNVIAHSKGGLDMRCALKDPELASMVASLSTINTPHRGCEFADYLLSKIPSNVKQGVGNTYNAALRKLGDTNPDFLAAVNDLTASFCTAFDQSLPQPAGVYCQSVGSKLNMASSGRFPLNFSERLVKHFDGANDGLVGEKSFEWGEHYEFLTIQGKRGISHGDIIDLNREDIPGFDVREYFVQLVKGLKDKGL